MFGFYQTKSPPKDLNLLNHMVDKYFNPLSSNFEARMLNIKRGLGILGGVGLLLSPSIEAQVDPLSKYQWYMGDSGFPGNQANFPGNINLSNVHSDFTGDGIVVVVSDEGMQTDHPDLVANIGADLSRNYTLPSPYLGDPTPTSSDEFHGTFVAGLIGASKNNDEGGFGVAPDATIVGFNFLNSNQSLPIQINQANLASAHVFNYSYGPDNSFIAPSQVSYLDALKNFSFRRNQNYVVAAGNEFATENENGDTYLGNANYSQDYSTPYTIVVAALAHNALASMYSTPGSNVWISAPGGDSYMNHLVYSTDLTGCSNGIAKTGKSSFNGGNQDNPNCDYGMSEGTSFASPIVAGVVALMKDANPTLTWRDVKHILAETAIKVDPSNTNYSHPFGVNLAGHIFEPGWITNAAGYPFHNWYGFGMIDAEAAVTMAQVKDFNLGQWFTTQLPNYSSFYKSATLNLAIPDYSATGVSHTIPVNRHNMNVEHVRVKVKINHTYPSDVGLELTSPEGSKSVLKYINDEVTGTNIDATFGSNTFYGESANGNWTLKVIDGFQDDVGQLVSWQLFIDGNNSGTRPELATPKAPTKATIASRNRITITQASQSNLLRHEACIYVSGTCNEVDWFPLSSLKFTPTHYSKSGVFTSFSTIKKRASFNLAVRAVNTSEKRSAARTFKFKKN